MDSYPADSTSLKDWPGAVLSLYSSIEKVSDDKQMTKILNLLPSATWLPDIDSEYPEVINGNYTVIHQIDGGCHSYFGSYGPQDGDYNPTITRAAFHQEVIDYMTVFFANNSWGY